ncbi:MAG TPA: DNA polymerase III subunit alpha [Candidatus Jorgensenbacteria bacterium]|nr:DNA polymerase III subunit alpha [Candidatus Jorgensenbacteria bacterium]
MKDFVHLHVHSHYSLLDGLAKIDDLVRGAKEHNMDALALTDHGNLYGAIEFYKKAKKDHIKPILGIEAYVAPNGRKNKGAPADRARYHTILLAKNNVGWHNLLKLSTDANLEGFYYKPRIDRESLEMYHEGLICLSGCQSGEIAKHLLAGRKDEAEAAARWYQKLFGKDFYIELQPHTPELNERLKTVAHTLNIPLVATQDIHYIYEEDKTAHEILLAVQTRNQLDDKDRLTLKEFNLSMQSGEIMGKTFSGTPEALTNTRVIADACNVKIELGTNKMPNFPTLENKTAQEYLVELVYKRLPYRYKKSSSQVLERLENELDMINRTGFANYFLIVQDIVNWAKEHGIVVGPGRGSAAGSLVSYVLGITNIDPLTYDLLFERFLNPDRIQVPDIDIDFTDTRRDEVIAYVRERYGDDRVAQIITFGTMMARAAIRDTGRALGLPYGLCDQIAKLIPFNTSIEVAFDTVPELKKQYKQDEDVRRLIDSAKKLEGVARHASVHACGVVISPEPLVHDVPLQRAPQGEDTILTQFEMHSVEDLGLLKMDFLGLRNLTIIENTLRLIELYHGKKIDINNLPLDDKKTFLLLQKAETTGVFQLESSGMRRYLKQLKPSEMEDIIAMIALYRPGPMDLIPHYIRRKFGKEEVTYLHPDLEPILSSTYGVGIYQEQMMRIARDLAGYTLGEADVLRKAIGKKIKKLLDEQKEKLLRGLIKHNIDKTTAKKIWDLFPPFARYGFNRSHAASYAMISFQTAYLKAHYPIELMTSLLNTSGGDVERINFLVSEAKRLGIKTLSPDINISDHDFTIDEDRKSIRFGLSAVKNIGHNIVDSIINERAHGGPFKNLTDLLSRIQHRDMNRKSLEALIKSGALDSLGTDRAQALENLDDLVTFNQEVRRLDGSNQGHLFGTKPMMSLNLRPAQQIDEHEILAWEKELLGLYLTDHPFNKYIKQVRGQRKPIKKILEQASNGRRSTRTYFSIAGIVARITRIMTKKGEPMLFVTIEDESEKIEVLVFNNTLEKSGDVWEENRAVIVTGPLSFRDDEPKLICNQVKAL